MNENTKTNNEAPAMVCPVCGKSFLDLSTYAAHMVEHSNEEKRRKAEEEKKRMADQKKVDASHLEKLRAAYINASNEYTAAKEKYYEKYHESFTSLDDFLKNLSSISDVWSRWL